MDARLVLLSLLLPALGVAGACPPGIVPPCDCVRPQTNVTWGQISGTWYLIEEKRSNGMQRDVCIGMILSSTVKAEFEKTEGHDRFYLNKTIKANSPSTWYESNPELPPLSFYTHVVLYSEDLSSLVLVACVPSFVGHHQWTAIFNRKPVPSQQTLNTVYKILPSANVSALKNPWHYDNKACL